VALGASETYGVGATPFSRGYAHLVAHALHARHFQDLGIPGATLSSAYDVELGAALSSRPELSTLFFGVNDLNAHIPRDSFLADLHDLALTLRRAGSRVLIIGLPDLTLIPAVRAAFPRLAGTTESWNKGMASVARQTGSRFLNLSRFSAELASHPDYIAPDGLHPSNAGHRRLAQVVLAAIHSDRLWT
jgi:lysophospholipase L1-like esterase